MTALRFDDQVVVVTGAGRGIGLHYARGFAERGARVVVCDAGTELFGTGHDASLAEAAVAAIVAGGGTALPYSADLATEDGARGAVRAALEAWGRIDVLVHNAGFTSGGRAFAADTLARLDAQLAINARAAFALANEAWRPMIDAGSGRIVLTSSSALHGLASSLAYSTAKAALVGLTRGLAAEGRAHGILVNAIEPVGATRMAEHLAASEFRDWFLAHMDPALVAPVVLALASKECTISGEMIVAGGGRIGRTIFAEVPGVIDPQLTAESALAHLDRVIADPRIEVLSDGAAASQYHANLLGFRPTRPVSVAAGAQED